MAKSPAETQADHLATFGDGGPAFPTKMDRYEQATGSAALGMSLRDYFAGQALIAVMSQINVDSSDTAAALAYDIADAMLEMIRGGFEALVIGDPADLATDVGPVIDAEAKALLDDHIAAMRKAGRRVWQREISAASGTFVAPAIIEIGSIADLQRENFGPVLHVARFAADELEEVIEEINATGYGLTLGLHSRIDATRRLVESRARAGNFYVNRNQIGAVVESQPFGGEGLSGTGPKAGGPHYVARFATERVTCIDTTAAGGNASLMAALEG